MTRPCRVVSTTDVNGAERDDTSPAALRTVLDDLRARREAEHASVSVSHRSRSNLELFTDLVVLENVDTNPGTERHARGVADADRLTLGTGGRGSWGCRRTA